jgi:hypothetical protein
VRVYRRGKKAAIRILPVSCGVNTQKSKSRKPVRMKTGLGRDLRPLRAGDRQQGSANRNGGIAPLIGPAHSTISRLAAVNAHNAKT